AMTAEQLQEIKTRAEAATPGPWEWDFALPTDEIKKVYGECSVWMTLAHSGIGQWVDGQPGALDDADFIAHARTDVPALIAEVERLKAQIATNELLGSPAPICLRPEDYDEFQRLRKQLGCR